MTIRAEDIVAETRRWIGTPYRHQASAVGAGADCLGLVRGVWRAVIGPEPEEAGPYSPVWAEMSGEERMAEAGRRHFRAVPAGAMQAGDVLLFRFSPRMPARHAGILSAPGRFIHAFEPAGVAEAALCPWWRRRLAFVFRFPGVDD